MIYRVAHLAWKATEKWLMYMNLKSVPQELADALASLHDEAGQLQTQPVLP